jgi:hypothetical protein
MTTQKEIAASLDLASIAAGSRGASKKQVWFLAGLLAKAGEEASGVIESGMLTSRAASFYINQILNEKAA